MTSRLFCLLTLIVFISGCRENSSPELTDPIYIDLLSETGALERLIDESDKKIEAKEKDWLKTKPRTIERKNTEAELLREKERREKIRQMLVYYKIRTERRKVEGRRAYKIAYRTGEPWPKPEEFEAYKQNKKLLLSSKNWNDRVPKPNLRPGDTVHEVPAEKPAAD
jgi:hypothetical protein